MKTMSTPNALDTLTYSKPVPMMNTPETPQDPTQGTRPWSAADLAAFERRLTDVHRIFWTLEEQPVEPCLLRVKTDSENTRELEMTRIRHGIVIGRSPEADWAFPEDSSMGRRHFEIREEDVNGEREWWIRDLASRNGLWVNGRKVEERRLVHGDQIRAGTALFLYHDGISPISNSSGVDS